MNITELDHLVLTVKDIQSSIDFYSSILGMNAIDFANERKALTFGGQKINLHQAGSEFSPHAKVPTPGSADLCFICETDINDIINQLLTHQVKIIEGPVKRSGATGNLLSIYIYDPDYNLIELSNIL